MFIRPDKIMEGFADVDELRQYEDQGTGFKLGAIHPDHGVNFDAAFDDDRNLLLVAGSRGQKGVSIILPNLLTWKSGLLCVDPKGENASISAMRRGYDTVLRSSGSQVTESLNQPVYILDPFRIVRGPARMYRVSYDPLTDIDVGSYDEGGQIMGLADAIVVEDTSGATSNANHFEESVKTVIAGMVEAALHKNNGATLSNIRDKALGGLEGIKGFVEDLDTPAGLAADAFSILTSAGDEEAGGFITTLSRQLRWMADPRVQSHLQPSTFSMAKAMREGASVYLCVPPSRLIEMQRWTRIMVSTALDAKMKSAFEPKGERTLFLLDEFFALGRMSLIETSSAYMAGYGIKLLPIVQNIGQLKIYGDNWETFAANAGAIIGFSLNDAESEKYFSERIGKTLRYEASVSDTLNKARATGADTGMSKGTNYQIAERYIRWPNEIHDEGAREQRCAFVISAKGKPFTVQRRTYFDGHMEGLYDSPDAIAAWEARLSDEDRERFDAI